MSSYLVPTILIRSGKGQLLEPLSHLLKALSGSGTPSRPAISPALTNCELYGLLLRGLIMAQVIREAILLDVARTRTPMLEQVNHRTWAIQALHHSSSVLYNRLLGDCWGAIIVVLLVLRKLLLQICHRLLLAHRRCFNRSNCYSNYLGSR